MEGGLPDTFSIFFFFFLSVRVRTVNAWCCAFEQPASGGGCCNHLATRPLYSVYACVHASAARHQEKNDLTIGSTPLLPPRALFKAPTYPTP